MGLGLRGSGFGVLGFRVQGLRFLGPHNNFSLIAASSVGLILTDPWSYPAHCGACVVLLFSRFALWWLYHEKPPKIRSVPCV